MNGKRYSTVKENRNGGGTLIREPILDYLRETISKPSKVLEMCSGPCYIGKHFYENDFCDELHAADVNKFALPYDEYITKYVTDGFDKIPEQQYDLIVCPIPWFPHRVYAFHNDKDVSELLTVDPQFRLHKKIYSNAHQYLKDGGHLLMIECIYAVDKDSFRTKGLELIDHFHLREKTSINNYMTNLSLCLLYRKNTNG